MPNDLTPPPSAPNGAPLGKLAKSVDADPSAPPPKHQTNRSEAFRLQRLAARILGRERVGKCMWSVADLTSQIRILRRTGRSRFEGLQTCGSVWHCPRCSATISETRRQELNKALQAARAQGLSPVLITLTFRHKAGDDLPTILAALKAAKKHWHDSRTYRGHKAHIVGVITATEITHGKANGWHPHLHLLMFLRLPSGLPYVTTQEAIRTDLKAQWLASLEASGLDGNGAAFDFQPGDAAGQYVAKWGAAEELTLSAKKGGTDPDATPGKTPGLHPFAILREAEHSPHHRALFYAYALAFKGRRQLQWTPGLRALFGVVETSDEEAAAEPTPDNQDEWQTSIGTGDWPALRAKGRARVLDLAEAHTGLLDDLAATLERFRDTTPDAET